MYGDDIQEAMEDPVMFHSMLENFPLTQAVNWFRPQVDFLQMILIYGSLRMGLVMIFVSG